MSAEKPRELFIQLESPWGIRVSDGPNETKAPQCKQTLFREVTSEQPQVVGEAERLSKARKYWGNAWPIELTNGVMFFEGLRITKDQFQNSQQKSVASLTPGELIENPHVAKMIETLKPLVANDYYERFDTINDMHYWVNEAIDPFTEDGG